MYAEWSASFFLLIVCFFVVSQGESPMILGSKNGTLRSRVYCREVIQCIGMGDNVFWSFFGSGVRIPNTDTRLTNTSSQVINNETFIIANLTFDPLMTEHEAIYVCHVQGNNDANINVRVFVDEDPVIIASDIPNVDISSRTVGETITIGCQVETCLSNVTVTFYKNKNVIQTTTFTNNMLRSFTYAYTLIVGTDSPGEYACRAVTTKGATRFEFFNITGTALLPSIITTTIPSTNTVTFTGTELLPSIINITTTSNPSSTSAMTSTSSVIAVPSNASVSPTSGGVATEMLAQWTLLLRVMLLTMIPVMMI